jgi:hypothetical protein
MKLNVGVSRKLGLPNFGSVGASCNLELELDATLLERDLDAFHNQIRGAYVAAHQAVHDELVRLQTLTGNRPQAPAWTSEREQSRNGCDGENRNGHSRTFQEAPSRGRQPATPNQIKAILAIARKQNADVGTWLRREYRVEQPEELTIRQASELIDLLNSSSVA